MGKNTSQRTKSYFKHPLIIHTVVDSNSFPSLQSIIIFHVIDCGSRLKPSFFKKFDLSLSSDDVAGLDGLLQGHNRLQHLVLNLSKKMYFCKYTLKSYFENSL